MKASSTPALHTLTHQMIEGLESHPSEWGKFAVAFIAVFDEFVKQGLTLTINRIEDSGLIDAHAKEQFLSIYQSTLAAVDIEDSKQLIEAIKKIPQANATSLIKLFADFIAFAVTEVELYAKASSNAGKSILPIAFVKPILDTMVSQFVTKISEEISKLPNANLPDVIAKALNDSITKTEAEYVNLTEEEAVSKFSYDFACDAITFTVPGTAELLGETTSYFNHLIADSMDR